ncbi:dephospho-CoA kinase [Hanstruepera flava]|uniref:dephospho-CoA kinase n=1 Tax=Hanstruepera flava TaxID=2930218 RepID=UPI0020278920|nr:dephospho-CoA kinase [Hanstruepera flava]
MKIVGITGGIGSGKTTVANMFKEFGVPVYNSDIEAKALMNRSKVIKRKLIGLFGEKAYQNNILNRPYIAQIIFNNKELLERMNSIVHPKVGQHFKRWLKKHNEKPYVLKESAILFETGGYKNCDYVILVTAPITERIKRVIKRDNSTQEKVQAIINNQSKDDDNKAKAHFVINNLKLEDTHKQVLKIHKTLLKSY